jgi:mitochondrial fission protein ELM1
VANLAFANNSNQPSLKTGTMGSKKETCSAPIVWTLLGQKAGDNNQVLALAESLGWGWTEKHLHYISLELIPNRLLKVTLLGLKKEQSDELGPPWPDLVISAGRRNEPVARWIRKQTAGHCRLVHIGRPWARPKHFDLIVTTPQYDLPKTPNVLYNELPLHRIDQQKLAAAAQRWRPGLAHLPQPWIAVLVGGNSSCSQFTAAGLRYLARAANAMAASKNGALLVTTSARSPEGTLEVMKKEINVPALLFDYNDRHSANPYFGFLALADCFIVTAESISMLTESCATGKPVYLYDALRPEHAGEPSEPNFITIEPRHPVRTLGTWLRNHLGPKRMRRDIARIHEQLIQQKRILMLGDAGDETALSMDNKDLENTVRRVRELFPGTELR